MYEGVDTVVLYDELAYHDVLPVEWKPLPRPLDRFELIGLDESNTLLLQACIAVEEHPARDKDEDLGPLAGELARLDFKLNLVLQLLGKAGIAGTHLGTHFNPVQCHRRKLDGIGPDSIRRRAGHAAGAAAQFAATAAGVARRNHRGGRHPRYASDSRTCRMET